MRKSYTARDVHIRLNVVRAGVQDHDLHAHKLGLMNHSRHYTGPAALSRGREGEQRTREMRRHRAWFTAATGSLPGLLPRPLARLRKVIVGPISARLHPLQGALLLVRGAPTAGKPEA